MNSRTTRAFRKSLRALPPSVRERAAEAFRLFKADPDHRSLNFKQIHSSRPIYSARIGLSYRALAVREGDVWVWFWVGHHAEYDNLLQRI